MNSGSSASPPPPTETNNFYIVGIGASAGGLEALQTFFDHMPPDSGAAFVVIQHLSPDYKSLMVELLSKHTQMEVIRAGEGQDILPNKIYLIPPKKNMTVFHGRLLLTNQEKGLNLPIDLFFRSLAEDRLHQSIGIVLSGTGSDGTRGIQAIKENGGIVMVQEESSAKFSGMPSSAIATGLADFILPAEKLPGQLSLFLSHPIITQAALHVEMTAGSPHQSTLDRITAHIRKVTGIDFSEYKPSTVIRRIERRMGISQLEKLEDYYHYLSQSPKELQALTKDLLISVTKFFRNPEAFDSLAENVLPELIKIKSPGDTLRIWVAGCATGEEVYSLAIAIDHFLSRQPHTYFYKIFATDIDKDAIEIAAQGLYPRSITADVKPQHLEQYFISKGEEYQIARPIRDNIVFATQNVLKDPPFTRIDIITCRNLLIYLQPQIQQKLLLLFHFSLTPGGLLFLGNSETTGSQSDFYETLDAIHRIYTKKGQNPTSFLNTPSLSRLFSPDKADPAQVFLTPKDFPLNADLLNEQISSLLLEEHLDSCAVIDTAFELLFAYGKARRYLTFPSGKASLNLKNMLPRDLSIALTTAVNTVLKEEKPVQYNEIKTECNGSAQIIDLRVLPLPVSGTSHRLLLVFFLPSEKDPTDAIPYEPDKRTLQRVNDLEGELQNTREHLQATIEELEASNEELQATNEELIASNEELQSTNEELESVNEELYTVNAEYQGKISELTDLHDDMQNYLSTSEVGTIFLDAKLCIRKFTPSITTDIGILTQDIGRPLSDLAHPVILNILHDTRQVLEHSEPIEKTIYYNKPDEQWILARIVPYRKHASDNEGVVITLINITASKKADAQRKRAEELYKTVLATVDWGICVTDEEGNFLEVNDAYCHLYGYTQEELIDEHFTIVIPPEQHAAARKMYDEFIQTEQESPRIREVLRKDGSTIRVEVRSALIKSEGRRLKVTGVHQSDKQEQNQQD